MKRPTKIAISTLIILLLIFTAAFIVLPLPGTVPVLMYHFIDTPERAREEKNVVSRGSFAFQMAFLNFFGYRVISLDEFYEIETGQRKPRGKELVLTFDDGNYTFETNAYPILAKYSFPVALFVVSESVKQEINGSMSVDTLKKMLGIGWITVASHSKTHPSLSTMTDEQIEEELAGSKEDLEEMLGIPIRYLSYPSGDVDERVVKTAEKAGYRLAFTTSYKKLKGIPEGPYTQGRVKISRSSDNPFAFWAKISGLYHAFKRERYRFKNMSKE